MFYALYFFFLFQKQKTLAMFLSNFQPLSFLNFFLYDKEFRDLTILQDFIDNHNIKMFTYVDEVFKK